MELTLECNIVSSQDPPLIGCPIMNSPRLTDGVTGEGSLPLNTDQFVGWDNQNGTTFIIVPEFISDVPPRQVDIYFHNNPAMGIGLPPIVMLDVAYQSPGNAQSIGPLRFTYANNQHLIQSNNNTTLISVVITTDYVTESFPLPFNFLRLHFDFSSSSVGLALISEMKVFTESGKLHTFEVLYYDY